VSIPEPTDDGGALVPDDACVVEDNDQVRDVAEERFLASLELLLTGFVTPGTPPDDEPGDDRDAQEQDHGPRDDDLRAATDDHREGDVDERDGQAGEEDVGGPRTSKSASKPAGVELRGHRCRLGPSRPSLNRPKVILQITQTPPRWAGRRVDRNAGRAMIVPAP